MSTDTTLTDRRRSDEPSGRFVLRISPGLHAELRASADEAGISLNDLCTRRLTTGADGSASGVVLRAAEVLGDELLGVVGYGSWARGELTASSDVDLLLIVSEETRLTRDLYRCWDRGEPLTWGEHPVESHFVHLPDPEARVSALWAEVAFEGIVLFERSYQVSRALLTVRRRVRSGELTRRRAHGHPYWVEAA